MKKKIIAILLAVALLAVAVVSGTLAYFTDEDTATNTFVVGEIDIELHEDNDAGAIDEDYKEWLAEQTILPDVEVEKDVWVKNVGANEAYVRVIITIPGYLNPVWDESVDADPALDNGWTIHETVENDDGTTTYTLWYNQPLDSEATTIDCLTAVVMDKYANQDAFEGTPTLDVLVNVQAIQTKGFEDDPAAAFAALDEQIIYEHTVEVGSDDDLMNVLANATEGEVIYISLTGDVEYPTNSHNGADDITRASAVVIDGQGQYKLTATGYGVTPIGDTEATLTLQNLTVVDETVSYEEDSWEFGYLELANVVCDNVEFTDPIMVEGNESSFINCSFVGYTDTGVDDGKDYSMTMYGVWAISGAATFEDCTFTGTRGMKVCDSNTSGTYASADVNVVIDGCTFDQLSQKPGVAIDYSGDTEIAFAVTIKNSTFINCQPGDQDLYIYETDNYVPVTENNNVVAADAIVSDATELAHALTAGKTVVLANDIDATAGIVIAEGATLYGNGHSITYSGTEYDDYQLIKLETNSAIENITVNNYRIRTESTTNGDITLKNVTINMDNDLTGLDISRGAGTATLTNVECKGITDATHLDPSTQVQVDYTPYGDVLLGVTWALKATDCDFGSLHGWNTTNGSNVWLNNTECTVFRMHYWSNRTLYINGVQTAWADSDAIPVAHDVGGCWSVQPAFK